MAIGTPWSDGNRGFVQVYQLIDDKKAKWEELGQSITGESVNDGAGFSLAISELGNILAIGAPSKNSDAGYVKVYEFRHDEEPIWKQRGTDIVGINGERLGESISLSALGDILGIGAMKNNYSGENSGRAVVYRYDKVELDYKQLGTDIFGREADGYFGVSVDVSSDGMSLTIGGHGGWLDWGWSIPGYAQVYKFKNSTLTGKVSVDIYLPYLFADMSPPFLNGLLQQFHSGKLDGQTLMTCIILIKIRKDPNALMVVKSLKANV